MNDNKTVVKKNRVTEAIAKEWKYENLILVVLALFAIELGVLILNGTLTISDDAPLIGGHAKLFSWILVGLGAISTILAVSSFYRPSFAEIKHVTGLSKINFVKNVFTVLIFSVILALLFVGFDLLIEWFIGLF